MKNIFTKIISASLLSSLLLMTTACAGQNGSPSTESDTTAGINKDIVSYRAVLTADEIAAFPDAFVNGLNQYGWAAAADLYSDENLAISPASLELALLMTRTGAIGETSDEMKAALSMTDLTDEEILSACRQLMWRANTNGMEAANSLWMQKDYAFADSFISTSAESFMADAFGVDFFAAAAGATDAINAWASDKTHGKIPEMNPEPLPADTRLVLINALYFLGDWETPFTAENSYDQVFHGTKEDTSAAFMHDTHNMLYGETGTYQIISMPFKGSDDNADSPYSMAFILPAEGTEITAVMDELSEKGFTAAVSGMSDEKVQIALPKFEFTFDTSMVNTMKNLGMNLAFEDSAQFDGMTGSANDLYISDILHKCYIRVDEEGAEAAAVTEVIMTETSIQIDDNIKTFTADRPFLFAIYDETDNTVLFLGAFAKV